MAKSSNPAKQSPAPVKNGKPADPIPVNQLVFDILEDAKNDITGILQGSRYSAHINSIQSGLTRLQYRFRVPGQSFAGHQRKTWEPITPRELNDEEKPTQKTLAAQARNQLSSEIAHEVEAVYDGFTERETEEILDSMDDILIRAVAKAANMTEVTETNPKRITPVFVDQIKEAIKKRGAEKALIDNPPKVLADKIAATEKKVEEITAQKETVEEALSKETDEAKKAGLQKRLADLTEQEGGLYQELDQLTAANSENASDQD